MHCICVCKVECTYLSDTLHIQTVEQWCHMCLLEVFIAPRFHQLMT